ncbi:hypothetical protein EDC96DRAFT_543679 [Choanephora cucurbitarum]|nr:hypothetical protein EDC96DRAFT_543679 [Choanephora cucurbitarum]
MANVLPTVQLQVELLTSVFGFNQTTIRSAGRISLSDSSLSASKGKDSCIMLKPDFCIMYELKGNDVGLLAIEMNLPNAASSQLLSDGLKLGLTMKRMSAMIDTGSKLSKKPRSNDSNLKTLVKPTVDLPTKRTSCS